MEQNIQALIQNGAVAFSRSERNQNVVCVWTPLEGDSITNEGRTVAEAVFAVAAEAQRRTTVTANPHLQP